MNWRFVKKPLFEKKPQFIPRSLSQRSLLDNGIFRYHSLRLGPYFAKQPCPKRHRSNELVKRPPSATHEPKYSPDCLKPTGNQLVMQLLDRLGQCSANRFLSDVPQFGFHRDLRESILTLSHYHE